jgi:hypothetical protein
MDEEELKAIEVELPKAGPAPAGAAHAQAAGNHNMLLPYAQVHGQPQAGMGQIIAGGHQPNPNPAFINFNINFGIPQGVAPNLGGFVGRAAPPVLAAPVVAARRQRRGRRR